MSASDPISDLLTRIRNAQERGKAKVSSPASRLRERVLEVLQHEGFIRGFTTVQQGSGKAEIEIELKYFDGAPVIRELQRVSKPGRRVYASVETLTYRFQRHGNFHSVDAEGRHVRCRCSHPKRGWRSSLHGILRNVAMSRIGKKAVPVPAGVTASVNGQLVSVKGPKGELKVVLNDQVLAKMEQGGIKVDPKDKSKLARSSWGMSRTLVANLVTGVTVGYSKSLEISGVGYRAAINGKALQLNLGYSHDVTYDIPAGIEIKVPKPTEIVISGIDKQRVGQVAAEIREYRGPEPYKGKGVKYAGEYIFRKEGKKK